MKRIFTLLLVVLLLNSCGDQKIDTALAKAEMEAREIKKVSEAEIVTEAMQLGQLVSASFQLIETLESDRGFKPSAFDSLEDYAIAYYFLDEPNDLKGKALRLFQAYQYNSTQGIESEDIVQKLEDENVFLYTKPSLINGKLVGIWTVQFERKDLVLNIKK